LRGEPASGWTGTEEAGRGKPPAVEEQGGTGGEQVPARPATDGSAMAREDARVEVEEQERTVKSTGVG
jgi:hypothetical protein